MNIYIYIHVFISCLLSPLFFFISVLFLSLLTSFMVTMISYLSLSFQVASVFLYLLFYFYFKYNLISDEVFSPLSLKWGGGNSPLPPIQKGSGEGF